MSARACAKFILGGEHSIVHRGYALALPLTHLELRVHPRRDSLVAINGTELNENLVQKVHELCLRLGGQACGFDIESRIPIGAGLGSSGALCTALARHFHPDLKGVELARVALEGEKLFHAHPSGVDPYTIAIEDVLAFCSRDLSYRIVSRERFERAGLSFVLADSGDQHSTSDVQHAVGKLKAQDPLAWEGAITALAANAERMIEAFESGEGTRLGAVMSDSHSHLQKLGVSTSRLDFLCDSFLRAGALGAKLTGAGCGGFAVGLFEAQSFRERGKEALRSRLALEPANGELLIEWPHR